jgi:peptidoglycan/LPS O-acetylase OafA/YrhL
MTTSQRNAYIDWLRAFSLIVVVLWHWVFTIVRWHADGPHATSPLQFTRGFWIFTWLLQVMPLFFYVGGYVHLQSWQRAQARGVRLGPFVLRRLRQLTVPAAVLLGVWVALGALTSWYFNWHWVGRAVRLVISPLWFLGVYLGLIALLPVALWLHRRFGALVLIWLAGATMAVDVLRFHYNLPGVGWLNMVLVWGLAHQAGFFYQKVVDAPRQIDWSLLWGGLFGLIGLVFSGLYPGSMVGVPGERFSNMAPPTFLMVWLLLFQIGVVEILRPRMEALLERPRWQRVNDVINRFALPLFLFHMTGMAVSRFLIWLLTHQLDDRTPDATWWVSRPLALIGPLVCTLPIIWLFSLRSGSRKPVASPPRRP